MQLNMVQYVHTIQAHLSVNNIRHILICTEYTVNHTECLKRVLKLFICLILKIFVNSVDTLYNGILRGFHNWYC